MRDPRNWARPAAAAVVGAGAGTALVVLRVRGRHRARRQQSATCSSSPSARSRTSPRKRGGSCPTAEPARGLGSHLPADSVTVPMAVCYRHPSRETGVSCSSCGRPICPDCMTPTSVGMRCPECARERTKVKTVRQRLQRRRRHPDADRAQRDRVPGRDGVPAHRWAASGRRSAPSFSTAPSSVPTSPTARVLAAAQRGVPARRLPPHRVQHGVPLPDGPAARAGGRAPELRGRLLRVAAGRLVRRAAVPAAGDRPSAPRAPPSGCSGR